jgi:lysophospholipase L1-like esterase
VREIKVIGSTLTPFENAFAGTPNQAYFSAEKEMKCQAVNTWIKTSGVFDGLVDFEKVIANPAHPSAIAQAYDSGDHIHPNDAGYRAMADQKIGGSAAQSCRCRCLSGASAQREKLTIDYTLA